MASAPSWKYKFGLLLIATVVIIWVASAEVTQLIFETYRHPFALTWLGASLLVVYLPIAYIKEALIPYFSRCTSAAQNIKATSANGLLSVLSPKLAISARKDVELAITNKNSSHNPPHEDDEEEMPLISLDEDQPPSAESGRLLNTKEIIKCALVLAPMWLLTEYLSNAALSMTSVASTTILSSTSGLFTLLFGVSMGEDTLSMPKIVAVMVTIGGVVMTELGKTSAADDNAVFGDSLRNPGTSAGDFQLPGHNVVGDVFGLASAISYGFYTTLLRKYIGGEEGKDEKADVQKVFGYIGLVTLLGLWWIVFPLHFLGWEPSFVMPSSVGLDEDILGNGLVGSVISDYFWALSVVWTTPLVATLGLSLTIPLAMVADMLMHGRRYSAVYIIGSAQVFAGFLIANLSDKCKQGQVARESGPAHSDKEMD